MLKNFFIKCLTENLVSNFFMSVMTLLEVMALYKVGEGARKIGGSLFCVSSFFNPKKVIPLEGHFLVFQNKVTSKNKKGHHLR